MIDIQLIRTNKESVIKSEKNRFRDTSIVNEVAELDKTIIKLKFRLDNLKKEFNILQETIKNHYKEKKDASEHVKNKIALEDNIKALQNQLKLANEEFLKKFKQIGNILDEEVPISKDEKDNKIIKTFNCDREIKGQLEFPQIMEKLGCDMQRGSKVFGHRGFYLTGDIALLGNALKQYAIAFLLDRGFILNQPPVIMKQNVLSKTIQITDFDDMVYNVSNTDSSLIATSEQPISAMYQNERIEKKDLPIRYCGESVCFRKEAGAYGKDMIGIFRTHQFNKVEQLVFFNEADKIFDECIQNACDFYSSLEINYQVCSIVSGALNDAAIKKYDLEAYYPISKRFRELVSCSDCTDYQSRELEIRCGRNKEKGKKVYVHIVNSTLTAIERTLCCIVENYQTETGVVVPDVLIPYMKKNFLRFK